MKAEYRKETACKEIAWSAKDMQECRVLELGTTEKETMQRRIYCEKFFGAKIYSKQ